MTSPGAGRQGTRWLARFAMWACIGVTAVVVIALLTAHGQVHDFAEAAVLAGVGTAVAGALLGWLARLPWRDIAAAAVLASLWDDMFGRRR